ncbi:MAG: metallophosphoesterase family protein [bacterium]
MKKTKKLNILFLSLFLILLSHQTKLNSFDIDIENLKNLNFYEWRDQLNEKKIREETFIEIITKFNTTCSKIFTKQKYWPIKQRTNEIIIPLKGIIISRPIKQIDKTFHTCALFTNNLEKTYVIGDLHGNFNDLFEILNYIIKREKHLFIDKTTSVLDTNLKLHNANLIFLGDYTDRGEMGLETLTTIMLLKIINPYNVVLIRGNHEDININLNYGFLKELANKFKKFNLQFVNQLKTSYALMPAAVYLTSDKQKFIHLSHAGFEFRYNPKNFLAVLNNFKLQFNPLELVDFDDAPKILQIYGKTLEQPLFDQFTLNNPFINFLWADILYTDESYPIVQNNTVRGPAFIKYNELFLNEVLKEYQLENNFLKFIRGHQHELPKKSILYEEFTPDFTSGVTNLTEKIITLISATIQCENHAITYYPTFMKLTTDNNGQFNIEAINIRPSFFSQN